MGRDGHEEDDRGNLTKIWCSGDFTPRVSNLARLDLPRALDTAANPADADQAHQDGGDHDEEGQNEQQVDRAADGFHEKPRQHPARDRAERGARADQAKQPFGLARVEQRIRQAPRLDGRDNAEAVDPDIQDARQQPEPMKTEAVPEKEYVRAEEQQRGNGHDPGAEAGGNP